jgi:hypothetical protein
MSLVSDVWSAVLVWVRGSDTSAMGGGGGASSVGVVASSEGVLGLPLATAEWACEALGVNTDVPQVRPLSLSIHNRIIPLAYPVNMTQHGHPLTQSFAATVAQWHSQTLGQHAATRAQPIALCILPCSLAMSF